MANFNVLDYPTPQDAANAAMASRGVLFIPGTDVPIPLLSPIIVPYGSRLVVRGEGYGQASNHPVGSVLQPLTDGFIVQSDRACFFESFQLHQPIGSAYGVGIKIDANQPTSFNRDTVVRDVCVTNMYCAFQSVRASRFTLDHLIAEGCQQNSVIVEMASNPDGGDQSILNCVFSSANVNAHILHLSGGGLRMVSNKFNGGKTAYKMQWTGQSGVLKFAANSVEGCKTGLKFSQAVAGVGVFEDIQICGNEIAGTERCIWTQSGHQWLREMCITGNRLITGGPTDLGGGIYGVACDLGGIDTVAVVGNTMRGAGNTRRFIMAAGVSNVLDVGNASYGGIC